MFTGETVWARRLVAATTSAALGGLASAACSGNSSPAPENVAPYRYILPATTVVIDSYCKKATLRPVPSASNDLKVEISRELKDGLPERTTELSVDIFGVGVEYQEHFTGNAPLTRKLPSADGEYLVFVGIAKGINGGESQGDGTYRNVCPTLHAAVLAETLRIEPEIWQQATGT